MMYEQQMNMFQEGGVMLEDEGGEVEEASGNDVPLGGVKEGVADDQEAKLSAGEMVLSEDVVRYHGVEKIMSLRDEAKMGYHKMEAMGQLGNSDEATIPTEAIFNPGGMPFSVVDLEYIEMGDDDDEAAVMAMADNEDEPIKAQAGTLVPVQQPAASFSRINPSTGLPEITAAPATSISQVLQPGTTAPITTGSTLTPTTLSSLTPTSTPISAPDRPASLQPTTITQLPTAEQFFGGVQGTNFFINEIGQVIQIPVVNGKQLFDEPEGFQTFDPSNPVPFDPDLEDDTVTTTDEQPQRRRTVTDREEGGQPSLGGGPEGDDSFSDPGQFGADVESAVENATSVQDIENFAEVNNVSFSVARDALSQRAGVEQTLSFLGIPTGTKARDARDKLDEQIATDRLSRARQGKPETPSQADARDAAEKEAEAIQPFSTIGIGPEDFGEGTPGDQTGGIGGSGAGGGDFDSGLGFDGSGFDGADQDSAGHSSGSTEVAKGGFIPKIKFKSKPKNRRKGLAARK